MSDYKIKEQRKMYGWKKGMNDGQTHRRLEWFGVRGGQSTEFGMEGLIKEMRAAEDLSQMLYRHLLKLEFACG